MEINGVWVGWGLGDHSSADSTVQRAKAYMRRMYRSYAGNLADTNVYDQQTQDAVKEMQNRLVADGKLKVGEFILGVLDLATQYAMGFKKPTAPILPIIFTVEGHMSNMWSGPCADTARVLEDQGVCRWQPIGYNSNALPFDNDSGVKELERLVSMTTLENGVKFPAGTPWGIMGYSQGGMVVSEFYMTRIRTGPLTWRAPDLKRACCYANPSREKGQVADWAFTPNMNMNSQGLWDTRMVNTPPVWREVWRHGDIFSENEINDAGEDKTAICKIVCNEWVRGQDSIFHQILELGTNPPAEAFAIMQAILSGVLFLGNTSPHYSPFDIGGGIEWMRGVKG